MVCIAPFMYSVSQPRTAIPLKAMQIMSSMDATDKSYESMPYAVLWLTTIFSPFALHSPLLRVQVVNPRSCNRCCWWPETPSELQQPSSWRGGLRGAGQRWQPPPAQSSGRMLSCTAPSTGCARLLECIKCTARHHHPTYRRKAMCDRRNVIRTLARDALKAQYGLGEHLMITASQSVGSAQAPRDTRDTTDVVIGN